MKTIRERVTGWTAGLLSLVGTVSVANGQPTINYNNQAVFLNGTNVAWVYFAGDLGPGAIDTMSFRSAFDSVHAHGGNCMRLWLHTNGTQSPQFDGTGRVIGPGANAVADLHRILDMAWQRKLSLLLCLWSFDMQRISIGSLYTTRNALMLNDTSYTHAYINNALVPLVLGVKGHPAIVSWEVFNEAEGMSNEFGWSDIYHVPMANIQRFVNLVAGAIHRTDSTAKVTTGAWALTAETDENPPAKIADLQTRLNAMTAAEQRRIEEAFFARYNIHETVAQILAPYATANYNYYRDDRLVAVGGDPQGTLDFYTSHYYDNGQPTSICPFLHSCSTYALTKPLVIAEFFPENTVGLAYTDLYRLLYNNGYAGALSWGWYSGATGHPQATLQANTMVEMQDLFSLYPEQIELSPVSGTIYAFSAQPSLVDSGEASLLDWKTSLGTAATLNGAPVPLRGTSTVHPGATTVYTLMANGATLDTARVTVSVYSSGTIIAFGASATTIGPGEQALLRWKIAHASTATLNDSVVTRTDSLVVRPGATTTYTLIASGAVRDTSSITLVVRSPDAINRALGTPVSVAGSSANPVYADPENAVDGDTATQWASATGTSTYQLITCDLGQDFLIGRVVVKWGSTYATSYKLLLSPDGSMSWNLARTIRGGVGGTEILDSVNQVGRYVQLLLGLPGASGFSIREMEVYGVQNPTAVGGTTPGLPDRFDLMQNFPNPFNPSTTISFALPFRSTVTISVFTILGQRVTTLVEGGMDAGYHTISWNPRVSSGVYFCHMEATSHGTNTGSFQKTIKLVLVR